MESVSCAKRLLVAFVSLMAFASIATTSSLRDKGTELRAIPENFRVVRSVTGRSWDFSGCAPECRLKLGGKILNKRNLVLTTLDAIKLAPLMHNETLEDRMYVWGEIASMASQREQGNSTNEYNVEELDKFEGDIIIGRETVDEMMRAYTLDNTTDNNNNARSKRRAITFDNFLWTGEIPWKFHSNAFTSAQQSRIKQAVKHWQDNTCVRFKQHPDRQTLTGPHIKFVKKSGCWSYIGKQKTGQDLSIGSTCFRLGVMSHEIGHALGLYHEQSRPDRDLYISINYGNIRGNPSINFAAKNWRFVRTLGIPYDYSSAMHYGAFDFSKNRKPTISPKDPRMQQVLGQRESLSFLDIKIINVLYCSDKCGEESLEWSRCKNGGYRDPNNCNQCKCPRGFAPPTCGGIARGVNANCGRQYLQAGAEEKSLVSPGYPNGYPDDADCAWLIRAPSHHRIKLQFQGTFVVQATRPTCLAYVEVRYKDVTRVGARYCWYTAPKDILFSHGVEALILLHTKTKGYRGFNLTYVAEKCGGCSRNAGGIEPVCFKSEKYDCSVEVNAICDRRLCKKKRKNTCIRESSYCCPGYQKSGDFCIRTTQRNPISGRTPTPRRPVIVPTTTTTTSTTTSTTTTTTTTTTTPAPPRYVWGLWSSWSACSATCGLCGSTVRQRSCLLGNCPGPRREARSCGNTVCPEAPPFEIRRLCDRNGKVCRFPLDFNCLQPRTCIQTIPRLRCCAGKIILNECVLEDLKLF